MTAQLLDLPLVFVWWKAFLGQLYIQTLPDESQSISEHRQGRLMPYIHLLPRTFFFEITYCRKMFL